MQLTLNGRKALITGGSKGLGLAMAKTFAQAGGHVALVARGADALEAAKAEIQAAAPAAKVAAIPADIRTAEGCANAAAAAAAAIGPIDILVNNAGVSGEGRALDLTPEQWDQAFAVNVRGVFFCAQAAARQMIESDAASRGGGRIVNIASIAAHTVLPGLVAYNTSKAAVGMMTRSLAREWARRQIAVNALCPGYVETDINRDWFATEGGQAQIAGFPRRRLMAAHRLDEAFMLLAGPAASAITGTLITVDDGQSLP